MSRLLPILLATAALPASAQTGPTQNREAMWPAPTAEDWAKPCLVTWQRTWEDAVAVSRATKRPILVCTNMDGEIASEHYAGIRYRDPAIAALYEPYVCVIASTYRHTPRDHGDEGERIECPRFGTVTCGEHIAIEPGLYERFFDGQRVAPRHVAVELDGTEIYDVYYAFDTASVFRRIEKGVEGREPTLPWTRGDLPLADRVASPHVDDRSAVERAYLEGDRESRTVLLRAALGAGAAAPPELLRLAIFGLDTELARLAREALAASRQPGSVALIGEALAGPLEPGEREALVAALEAQAETSRHARLLATVHRGLDERSTAVDAASWRESLPARYQPAVLPEWETLDSELLTASAGADERPQDGEAKLRFAESALAYAIDPRSASVMDKQAQAADARVSLLLEDAKRLALEAEALGATGWRKDTVLAVATYFLDEREEASRRAEQAVESLPEGEASWNAFAVLAIFAEDRQQRVVDAVREQRDWPRSWVADAHAAYSAIARHPHGTERQALAHTDFLRWVGANRAADRALEDGLQRFPDDLALHDRLRVKLFAERGAVGTLDHYEQWLARLDAPEHLGWQAGHTARLAAEDRRRVGERAEALELYARAREHFTVYRAGHPEYAESIDHESAVALAGSARCHMELGDLDAATRDLVESLELRPASAPILDGLNLSAIMTANTLRARAAEAERSDLSERLEAALAALPAELRRLPAFEAPAGRRPRR